MATLDCPLCNEHDLTTSVNGTFTCGTCGTNLVGESTRCPSCLKENGPGADVCAFCGEPLSIVARVLDRHGVLGPPLWLRRVRSQVAALQAQELEASDLRMETFRELDQRREQEQSEAAARQRARDQQMFQIVFLALAVFVVIVILVVLTSSLNR